MRYVYSVVFNGSHYCVMAQKQNNHFGVWVNAGDPKPLDGTLVVDTTDGGNGVAALNKLAYTLNANVADMVGLD